jgi:hypothetical protein
MRRLFLLVTLCLVTCALCLFPGPQIWTSVDMYQAIRKLNVLGTVLYLLHILMMRMQG